MHLLKLCAAGLLLGTGTVFAQQSQETIAITLQGKGNCTTRSFTVHDNWHIESSADSGIKINAIPADGSAATTLIDSPSTTPPAPSYNGTSTPVAKGGTYNLEVTTTGSWQITMVESGFTKNLAIGGVPVSPLPGAVTASPMPQTMVNGVPVSPGIYPPGMTISHDRTINIIQGFGPQSPTRPFTAPDGWEMQWTCYGPTKITLVPADGSNSTVVYDGTTATDPNTPSRSTSPSEPYVPPGSTPQPYNRTPGTPGYIPGYAGQMPVMGGFQHGTSYQAKGGTFSFNVEGKSQWTIRIVQVSAPTNPGESNGPSIAANSVTNPGSAAMPTPNANPAPLVKLTDDQTRAVVLIAGDNSEGTGFLVKMPDGPAVVTNIHVIANNPNLKITTNTGAVIPMISAKGASDRDLAVLSIKDAGYSYLEIAPDVSKTAQTGDEVVTPGNSQGGEVMLNTGGKVLGIGPQRIEIDNPIYHGNSGGPIFHTKSNQVVGVVTEAIKVDTSNQLDKASFASRNSAIASSMRYFGMRLDNVPSWIPIDWNRFQNETLFLTQFHQQSARLDSYLNTEDSDNTPESRLYRSDDKIMKANDAFLRNKDTDGSVQATKGLLFDLQGVADKDMDQIQSATNFYPFDQDRAQNETEYRKALKKELDKIGDDVDRLKSLPHSSN